MPVRRCGLITVFSYLAKTVLLLINQRSRRMDDYEGPQRSHVFHAKPGEEAMRLNTGGKKKKSAYNKRRERSPLSPWYCHLFLHIYINLFICSLNTQMHAQLHAHIFTRHAHSKHSLKKMGAWILSRAVCLNLKCQKVFSLDRLQLVPIVFIMNVFLYNECKL